MVRYLEDKHHRAEAAGQGYARLLIVDDHKNSGLTLKAILEREGFKVWYAPGVDKANALIRKNLFHAAILDLDLAGRSGLQVLETLRQRQPQCKPLILTGFPSLEAWEAAFQRGALAFLVKPCNLDELLSIIRDATKAEV
jgi:DNA-binding NtrC family response regulator